MRTAVADKPAAAQMRPAQTEAIFAHPPVSERPLSRKPVENTRKAALAPHQPLKPAGECFRTACKAAGCGDMQASGGKLPVLFGLPVTRHQAVDRIVPDVRRFQKHVERRGNMLLHEIVKTETMALQRRFHQTVTGIGIGNFAAGIEIQPGQPGQVFEKRASLCFGIDGKAKQRETLARIRQTAAHIERLPDRDVAQRRLQLRQMFAERIVEPDQIRMGQHHGAKDMLGD